MNAEMELESNDTYLGVKWWAINAARHVRLRGQYNPDELMTGVFMDDVEAGKIIQDHAEHFARKE